MLHTALLWYQSAVDAVGRGRALGLFEYVTVNLYSKSDLIKPDIRMMTWLYGSRERHIGCVRMVNILFLKPIRAVFIFIYFYFKILKEVHTPLV
jgi:hypothetical protein